MQSFEIFNDLPGPLATISTDCVRPIFLKALAIFEHSFGRAKSQMSYLSSKSDSYKLPNRKPIGGSAMMHKALLVTAASLALTLGAGVAMAIPAAPLLTSPNSSIVHKVTFWGNSFPYGYNWSRVRACTRYESVETPHGTRTERVWVCTKR